MTLRVRATILPTGFDATALNDAGSVVGTRNIRAVVFHRDHIVELPGRADARWGSSNVDEARAVSSNGIVAPMGQILCAAEDEKGNGRSICLARAFD